MNGEKTNPGRKYRKTARLAFSGALKNDTWQDDKNTG